MSWGGPIRFDHAPVLCSDDHGTCRSIRGEAMRAGITILPEYRWAEAKPRWQAAEEYGFAHAWTFDHLGWGPLVGGPWFGSVPTLSAAALVTSRIGLGFMVASPNFRHPVSFA